MADKLTNRFDGAIIFFADADLNVAVTVAREHAGKKRIDITAPPSRKNRNSAASFAIIKGKLAAPFLATEIRRQDGRITTLHRNCISDWRRR